jgi:NTP pyrophosphatase (non-canonical NTP hydrolase)
MTMTIAEFQKQIEETYGAKDRAHGAQGTFLWFVEEVGELARALNGRSSRENLRHEFADVLAWLATLASMSNVNLAEVATERYGNGCPRCHAIPCTCDDPADRPRARHC